MTPGFSKFLLKLMGWKCEGSKATDPKCVILEAPHTSIWDFLIGYLYYRTLDGHLKVMIKAEAFFFPVGPILKAMGGFPIKRESPQQTIMSVVHEMENPDHKEFHMVICPEGTRKAVHRWKTGYHTIATTAGVPVYVSYIDWKEKRVGLGPKVPLTGNAREDTDRIQQIYEDMHLTALHPEGYTTR